MRSRTRVWWLRSILGLGLIVACTGMTYPWDSRYVVIRPEIDLLLEDIRFEPTPDDIADLVSKATRSRQHGGWGFDGSYDDDYLAPDEVT